MRNLLAPRSFPGAEGIVSVATGSVQATMQLSAVIAEKIKHKHSQKESNFPLPSLTSALPPCSRPLEFIQPLAARAEAWQAIPGVSEWVMGIIKQGYSLQFARRPPRFSGVVSTSVQGENARVLRSEMMTLLEKGAIEMISRRLNPPRPLTVPTWDLPTVLRALKGPPFEPLQSTDLRSLSLKTALLLALASVKRVGDLQALSTSPACLEFGPNDSKVVLKPRHGYVPKVLSTPSELRSSRSPRFLHLRRTGSYLCYALSELWESTLSVPPLLGIRNRSLLASVTAPKDIRSWSRDSLSG